MNEDGQSISEYLLETGAQNMYINIGIPNLN